MEEFGHHHGGVPDVAPDTVGISEFEIIFCPSVTAEASLSAVRWQGRCPLNGTSLVPCLSRSHRRCHRPWAQCPIHPIEGPRCTVCPRRHRSFCSTPCGLGPSHRFPPGRHHPHGPRGGFTRLQCPGAGRGACSPSRHGPLPVSYIPGTGNDSFTCRLFHTPAPSKTLSTTPPTPSFHLHEDFAVRIGGTGVGRGRTPVFAHVIPIPCSFICSFQHHRQSRALLVRSLSKCPQSYPARSFHAPFSTFDRFLVFPIPTPMTFR